MGLNASTMLLLSAPKDPVRKLLLLKYFIGKEASQGFSTEEGEAGFKSGGLTPVYTLKDATLPAQSGDSAPLPRRGEMHALGPYSRLNQWESAFS